MLSVDWVFPTPSVEKRMMYPWTEDMMEERQKAYTSMREVQSGRVRQSAQMYKPLTQNIRGAGYLVWYFPKYRIWINGVKKRNSERIATLLLFLCHGSLIKYVGLRSGMLGSIEACRSPMSHLGI